MTQLKLLETNPCSRSRIERLENIAEAMGYDIQYAEGCAEPGYDDKPVVLGNWNERYDRVGKITDNTMPRLARLFEKLGYAVEWEDEWIICGGCNKIIRSQGNSYSWRQYFWLNPDECDVSCGNCVKDDPADYLKHLSGNWRNCDTIGLDLSKHGYAMHEEGFEAGWYDRHDEPEEVADTLYVMGITDFIFKLDYQGQFALGFSVWTKEKISC